MKVDGNVTLVATVTPDNATNKTVTWTSSDESIATVDENGKVTALKEGEGNQNYRYLRSIGAQPAPLRSRQRKFPLQT